MGDYGSKVDPLMDAPSGPRGPMDKVGCWAHPAAVLPDLGSRPPDAHLEGSQPQRHTFRARSFIFAISFQTAILAPSARQGIALAYSLVKLKVGAAE